MPSTDQSELTQPYANIYEFKTLLLVDDDRQLAETLQWILASENFLVEVAHNGNEAMAKISANPSPDLRSFGKATSALMPLRQSLPAEAPPLSYRVGLGRRAGRRKRKGESGLELQLGIIRA